jgi:hypothetical protein
MGSSPNRLSDDTRREAIAFLSYALEAVKGRCEAFCIGTKGSDSVRIQPVSRGKRAVRLVPMLSNSPPDSHREVSLRFRCCPNNLCEGVPLYQLFGISISPRFSSGFIARLGWGNLIHARLRVKSSFVNGAFALRSVGERPSLVFAYRTFKEPSRHNRESQKALSKDFGQRMTSIPIGPPIKPMPMRMP